MTEKLVHVNAYTRSDGTHVKEHYRNVDSESTIDDTGYLLQGVLENVQKLLESSDEAFSSSDLTQTLDEMLGVQDISTQFEADLLEALSQAKNQREYSPLYSAYMKQRDINKTTKNALQHLKYAIEKKDYDAIVSGLEEYARIQKENQKSLEQIKPIVPNAEYCPLPQVLQEPKELKEELRSVWKDKPDKQRGAIVAGMDIMNSIGTVSDAKGLLNLSVSFMNDTEGYIEQNGKIVESIEDIPLNLQDRVRTKVKEQLNVEDSRGVVFRPDSSLSTAISQSPEFRNIVKKHISELLHGEVVSDSVSFESTKNLHLALGRVDIVDAYINKNGSIVAYVLDTYDFNKDDPDWKVEWAHNVQEQGLLENYFVLSMVVVPKEEWLDYFIVGK